MADEIAELDNLKVVDLKDRLKDLGLSTAGLKKQLVQRLAEALRSGSNGSDERVETGQKEEDGGDANEGEVDVAKEEENVEERKDLESNGNRDIGNVNEKTENENENEKENENENENKIITENTQTDNVITTGTEAKSEADSNTIEDTAPENASENTSTTQPEPSTATDPVKTKRSQSPTENPPTKKPRVKSNSYHPPTNTLYISRLSRPLVSSAFQEHLETLADDTASFFWMDKLKTHCFVTFSSIATATTVRNAINHSRYPKGELSRKALFADYLPEATAHKFAEEEDSLKEWQKMRVYYKVNGSDIEISLLPVTGNSDYKETSGPSNNSRPPVPSAPRSSRRNLPVIWTRTTPSIKFREGR